MKSKIYLAVIGIVGISILACQKFDSGENYNISDNELSDNMFAAVADISTSQAGDASVEDIQSVSLLKFGRGNSEDMFRMPGSSMKFMIPHVSECATIYVSDSTYPQTITIDYGEGCTSRGKHLKKGKIIIEISDTLVVAGSVKSVKTEDFYIDNSKIELAASIENLGKNSAGNWVIASNYTRKITSQSGNVAVENYSDTTEWSSGFETIDKSDDIMFKTGSGTKTINDTLKLSHAITSPILIDKSCLYIKSGVVKMVRNSDTIVIDYGDGTCDSTATVTTNGATEIINLSTLKFKNNGGFGKHNGGGKRGKGHRCGGF